MQGHAQPQTGHGPHDDAQLEIHACTVEHRALPKIGIFQLGRQHTVGPVSITVIPISEIAVILAVDECRRLVHGLNSERRTYINDIIEIGPDRKIKLIDRTRIDGIDRPQNRSPRADGIARPVPILGIVAHNMGHRTLVGQHSRPKIGIAEIQPSVPPALRIGIGKNTVLVHLLRENIGDARHFRTGETPLGRIGITGIEIGDTVHAESERDTPHTIFGTLEKIECRTHIGYSEPAFTVVSPRLGSGRRSPSDRHDGCNRKFVVAIHAQTGRIERHGRQVGAQ